MRLTGSLKQALLQATFTLLSLHLLLENLDLMLQLLILLLFGLKTVGEEETLLNTTFSCGRGLGYGCNKGIAYCVLARVRSVTIGHMNDGLIKFFFYQFVLSEALFANSEFCSNISGALSVKTLETVVLSSQDFLLLPEAFVFEPKLFDQGEVILVKVSDSLQLITTAQHR
jgi:hypothetical protein